MEGLVCFLSPSLYILVHLLDPIFVFFSVLLTSPPTYPPTTMLQKAFTARALSSVTVPECRGLGKSTEGISASIA